ncbi:MAG: enoyl-CoA hydratase-related protein [Dehalococcoidia bacterium]
MPDTPTYEHITFEQREHIGLITLNRPEKLNAWTPTMELEFIDIVNRAALDRSVRALVVTGAGRAFCAGGDISRWSSEMGQREERRPTSSLIAQDGSPEVPIALTRGKPVIAAINGPAIGIGLTMALSCDIRLASDQATFSARFVKVGLTPECGSTRYLPLVAGISNALYLALTGRIIDAPEAKDRGLVDRLVPAGQLMVEAMALAEEIAGNPPEAIWAAKRLLHENAVEANLRRVVTQEVYSIREMRDLPDHAEAVQAFMEKRPPKFQ